MSAIERVGSFVESLAKGANRMDAVFRNVLTGQGTSRDPRTHSKIQQVGTLDDAALANLYRGDDMAARIVEALPAEALKKGFELRIHQGGTLDGEIAQQVLEHAKPRRPLVTLLRAWAWARLWGNTVILIGARDRADLSEPLREDRIESVDYYQILDRRVLGIEARDTDPLSPTFGDPLLFRVMARLEAGPNGERVQVGGVIHASRVVMLRGVPLPPGVRDDSWDDSVLQRTWQPLQNFHEAWEGAAHLLGQADQVVYKISSLMDMIANDPQLLQKRMETVDMNRSIYRAIVMDKDGEEFERVSADMAGIADNLVNHSLRLAGSARMPLMIMLGQSPPGLNATGENELEWWGDTVQQAREHEAEPALQRMLEVEMLAADAPTAGKLPEQWEVHWPPLRRSSPKEEAQIRKLTAEADRAYLSEGVYLPEEVALSRTKPGDFSLDVEIDREAREELLELERERKREMAENPPTPPPSPEPSEEEDDDAGNEGEGDDGGEE